jgi:GntR family transcriptional regulator
MAEPFYRRVLADIRARIASGQWPPGHKLPTNAALRDFYRVLLDNPQLANDTVQKAVTILKESGELRGQQGKAVYVAGHTEVG